MHPARSESPHTANCQLLYFTSYSVTADGGTLAAITNAWSSHPEGASLARIDRATGKMEPLAVFPGPAMQAYPCFARPRSANPAEDYLFNGTVATHGLNKSSPCLHPMSGNLFFVWGREDGWGMLDCVNLRDGRRRTLREIPPDRTVGYTHLDAAGEHVLLSLADRRILDFGAVRTGNREMSENYAKHGLTTQLAEVEVATGKLTVRWDTGEYPEQFVGRAPVDGTAPLQEISIPRDRPSFYGHFFPSRQGDFVITDAIANERGLAQRKGNLISRLNLDWAGGAMEVVPLCESNTSWHTQDNHPHPVLTPDQQEVLCTSDCSGVRRIYSAPAHG